MACPNMPKFNADENKLSRISPEPPKSTGAPEWRLRAERNAAKETMENFLAIHGKKVKKDEKAQSEEEPLEELTDGELKDTSTQEMEWFAQVQSGMQLIHLYRALLLT